MLRSLTLCALLLWSLPAAAQEPPLLARLQAFLDQTTSWSAGFTQESVRARTGRARKASGKVQVMRPGRIRWHVKRPEEVYYVTSGTVLWVYQPRDAVAYKLSMDKSELDQAVRFLAGGVNLAKEFLASEVTAPEGVDGTGLGFLKLEPRKASGAFKSLTLGIDPVSGAIRASVLVDPDGNLIRTRYEKPSQALRILAPRGGAGAGASEGRPMSERLRVHVRTLGCPKNQVDSELMAGSFGARDYEVVGAAEGADVLVVNTCGFIGPAKEASVGAILELAEVKRRRPGARLVVTGCLSQRHADALAKELPEVDLFLGSGDATAAAELFEASLVEPVEGPKAPRIQVGRPGTLYDPESPRLHTGPRHLAYVKIAEGCSQRCSFCIIPKLRGKAKSRTLEAVEAEVAGLVAQGVREVNLIAQDLTHYGEDLRDGGRTSLGRLLDRLVGVPDLRWIRLMYCYPDGFDARVVRHLAAGARAESKVVPYVDMPLQHIDDALLQRMRRRVRETETRALLDRLRREVPGIFLRTTFIVGFPGETRAQMKKLLDFALAQRFDHAGAFAYSTEEGTKAAREREMVSERTRRRRADRLGEVLRAGSVARAEARLGEVHEAVVEAVGEEPGTYIGRHRGQAPEIDGTTTLVWPGAPLEPGTFVRARLTHVLDLDLQAEVLEVLEAPAPAPPGFRIGF